MGAAATDLISAFEHLQQVRLRHQARRVEAGQPPDNVITLGDLGALDRRWLKDAFHLIDTCQESVRLAFLTDLIS
jgi:CBS domain-containing protein